jgi:protein-export membrane protein SecD
MKAEAGKAPTGFAKYPFKLGLDLSGGTHLVYHADVSKVASGEIKDSMNALRDVIERRVNIFGVSEPVIAVQDGGFSNAGEERLIVDLPGVTDVSKAVEMIGQTPLLEFKVESKEKAKPQEITIDENGVASPVKIPDPYVATDLTGRYLSKALLEFNPTTGEPTVSLQFNDEGSKLFEKITRENIGKVVAIYLDGEPISLPTVNDVITGGKAQITGNFTPTEAKLLVGRLNSGALPVPIDLISTQTIGPSLGTEATHAGVKAAIIGFLAIAIFLIVWYRLPGVIAVIALGMYVAIMLALFKLIPIDIINPAIPAAVKVTGISLNSASIIATYIPSAITAITPGSLYQTIKNIAIARNPMIAALTPACVASVPRDGPIV